MKSLVFVLGLFSFISVAQARVGEGRALCFQSRNACEAYSTNARTVAAWNDNINYYG